MRKKDDMEISKIIIGQGNGTSGMNAASVIIDCYFHKYRHLFLVFCTPTEVIQAAGDYPESIILLGNVWGGTVSGIDVALRVREVNKTARLYQYSLFPAKDPDKIFDGVVQKERGDELVSFLKGVLQQA